MRARLRSLATVRRWSIVQATSGLKQRVVAYFLRLVVEMTTTSSSSYGIYLFVVLWQLGGVGRVCLPVRIGCVCLARRSVCVLGLS